MARMTPFFFFSKSSFDVQFQSPNSILLDNLLFNRIHWSQDIILTIQPRTVSSFENPPLSTTDVNPRLSLPWHLYLLHVTFSTGRLTFRLPHYSTRRLLMVGLFCTLLRNTYGITLLGDRLTVSFFYSLLIGLIGATMCFMDDSTYQQFIQHDFLVSRTAGWSNYNRSTCYITSKPVFLSLLKTNKYLTEAIVILLGNIFER